MITVRNRTLIVPEGERVIGTDYDNNSEVRQFRVEKAPGGIDISHLAFRLDLMYQGEIYDTCKLEKEEREDSMILAWTVAATNVAHPGTVWISLRAIDDAGTVKWGSNAAALYVQSSVNTPSHASGMTELEEYEKKMEDLLLKSEEAVSRANNATSKAETAIQTTTEAANTAQTAATSAGSSANLAEAWAHGKEGYTAQANDNAMFWSEQSRKRAETAKEQANLAKSYADSIAPLMDRGEYSSGTTYQENDLVKYQNAIWRCKIDGTASVPQEGKNWTMFFRGVQSINELVAADAQGLLGQAGAQQVNAQALIDAVAEKIATKLLLKSDVVSQLVNDATKAASSAAVYALQQKLGTGDLPNGMSDVVAGLVELNSNFAYRKGDSLTIDNVVIFGCITLQKAHLIFHIPLNKPCFASSCKISGNFYVRQNGAFLPETPWTQPLSINVYSLGITLKGGMIVVDMTGHIWDTATNNEGCVVHLFDTTITFT